jgi:ribosomal-protein-alanine N-acetyltransferase
MSAQLRPAAAFSRPMQSADLAAVLAIEVTAYPFPWTRGNFIDSLASGYFAELQFDVAGTLLGYFVALPGFEETHLLNLTVAPPHQGQGHGRAMLARLATWARHRGDAALWLEVRTSNQGARRLYRQHGFVEVGLRRGYYPADRQAREDAVVMQLDLTLGRDLPPNTHALV